MIPLCLLCAILAHATGSDCYAQIGRCFARRIQFSIPDCLLIDSTRYLNLQTSSSPFYGGALYGFGVLVATIKG
jgi:hypothetical protein